MISAENYFAAVGQSICTTETGTRKQWLLLPCPVCLKRVNEWMVEAGRIVLWPCHCTPWLEGFVPDEAQLLKRLK